MESTMTSNATPAAAAAPTSIRANARNSSQSTGSQNSQDSNRSYYNLNYHRDGENEEVGGGGINLNTRYNPRICICDEQLFPITCKECNLATNTACERHTIVSCTQPDCTRRFHKECICSGVLTDATFDELTLTYICPECTCKAAVSEDAAFITLARNPTAVASAREKLLRFGIDPPHDATTSDLNEAKARMNKLEKAFVACNKDLIEKCPGLAEAERHRIINGILDTKPRPYPSPVRMDEVAVKKHVAMGRRAELSLLMYEVAACGCCGSVKPHHCDPDFPDSAPLSRMHLMNKSHDAWHCTCKEYCKGSQFYASRRHTVMHHYKSNHNQLGPGEYGEAHPNTVFKTSLCHKCYQEVTADKVDGNFITIIIVPFVLYLNLH